MSLKVSPAYWRYALLAEYHIWSVLRGQLPVGNDPISGRKWSIVDSIARGQARVENMAAARYYLDLARKVREGS